MSSAGAPGGPGGRPGIGRAASSSSDASSSRQSSSSQHQQQQQRRQLGRHTFSATPPPFYSSPGSESFQNQGAGNAPQQPPPHYSTAIGGQYPRQPGAFVGQYTMSSQSPVPMMQSLPQYSFSQPFHHPGVHTHASEPGMSQYPPSVGYGSASLTPQMHGQAPMYQYQRYSPEGASTSSSSGLNHPSSYDPSPSSHSPLPSHSHGGTQGHFPAHPPPPASFSSMHYQGVPTTTQFSPYSRESFAHSPSLYQSQYTQPYATYIPPTSPEDGQSHGGTWWYVPGPAASSAPSPVPPGSYDASQRQSQPFPNMYPMTPYSHVTGQNIEGYAAHTPPSFSPTIAQTGVPQLQLPQHVPESTGGSNLDLPYRSPISPLSGSKPPTDPSSSSHGQLSSSSRGPLRQPYHPNPPANRSEWVMWVGNVPSDATHDELWRFFNQPLASVSSAGSLQRPNHPHLPSGLISPLPERVQNEPVSGGVLSIFLISRSNCAFVNFETEVHLEQAVRRFNGQQIRSNDPRCARLVCRVRRKDDDLKSGVGGQRGIGMHTQWVKEQKARARDAAIAGGSSGSVGGPEETNSPTTPDLSGSSLSASMSSPSHGAISSEDEARYPPQSPSVEAGRASMRHSSSSGSYASTNSSFLVKNFSKRYFIMKSLTVDDLDLSVERGVWATQPHNEVVLNQAYRTSTDVFLIFGANKSGEFFGYARMAGPISLSEERMSWASRDSVQHSPSASVSSARRSSRVSETIPEESSSLPTEPDRSHLHPGHPVFSPSEHRSVDESPQPVSSSEEKQLAHVYRATDFAHTASSASRPQIKPHDAQAMSAPPEMHRPHRKITFPSNLAPVAEKTLDPNALRFEQPPEAQTAYILDSEHPDSLVPSLRDIIREGDEQEGKDTTRQIGIPHIAEEGATHPGETRPETWGTPFRVHWIRTERLPFYRTRHLRNPWNHDREVKVSRDGTEIEPNVGQALLDEWDKNEPETPPPMSPANAGRRGSAARLQAKAGSPAISSTQSLLSRPRSEGSTSTRPQGRQGGGGRP